MADSDSVRALTTHQKGPGAFSPRASSKRARSSTLSQQHRPNRSRGAQLSSLVQAACICLAPPLGVQKGCGPTESWTSLHYSADTGCLKLHSGAAHEAPDHRATSTAPPQISDPSIGPDNVLLELCEYLQFRPHWSLPNVSAEAVGVCMSPLSQSAAGAPFPRGHPADKIFPSEGEAGKTREISSLLRQYSKIEKKLQQSYEVETVDQVYSTIDHFEKLRDEIIGIIASLVKVAMQSREQRVRDSARCHIRKVLKGLEKAHIEEMLLLSSKFSDIDESLEPLSRRLEAAVYRPKISKSDYKAPGPGKVAASSARQCVANRLRRAEDTFNTLPKCGAALVLIEEIRTLWELRREVRELWVEVADCKHRIGDKFSSKCPCEQVATLKQRIRNRQSARISLKLIRQSRHCKERLNDVNQIASSITKRFYSAILRDYLTER